MDCAKSGTEARAENQGAVLSLQSMNILTGSQRHLRNSVLFSSRQFEVGYRNSCSKYIGKLLIKSACGAIRTVFFISCYDSIISSSDYENTWFPCMCEHDPFCLSSTLLCSSLSNEWTYFEPGLLLNLIQWWHTWFRWTSDDGILCHGAGNYL